MTSARAGPPARNSSAFVERHERRVLDVSGDGQRLQRLRREAAVRLEDAGVQRELIHRVAGVHRHPQAGDERAAEEQHDQAEQPARGGGQRRGGVGRDRRRGPGLPRQAGAPREQRGDPPGQHDEAEVEAQAQRVQGQHLQRDERGPEQQRA
jgi:hypothetical protein